MKQSNTTRFFYQSGKLITVNQGGQSRAIFRAVETPLAEYSAAGTGDTALLATDNKGSVLAEQDEDEDDRHAFDAYGYAQGSNVNRQLTGFNGEYLEPASIAYLLGNGHHRPFRPELMRFIAPDSWSPFGEGGANCYAYCNNDPVNFLDPSGHGRFMSILKGIGNLLGLREKSPGSTEHERSPSGAASPPEYTVSVPAGHSVKAQARDIKIKNADELEKIAHDNEIAGKRARLKNLNEEIKGRQVNKNKKQREQYFYRVSEDARKKAQDIRNSPDVVPPPRYVG